MLENLSPQQKQILMVGAPVVAVFALVASRKGGRSGTTSGPQVVGAQAGVDAGEFGEFLNSVNSQVVGGFDRLQGEIDANQADLQAAQAAGIASQADAIAAINGRVSGLSDQVNNMRFAPAPATPAPAAAPAQPAPPPPQQVAGYATIVANPIQGDNSVFVQGMTADGHPYTYGGSQEQANLLVKNTKPDESYKNASWYGKKVDVNDPNVPDWYKQGFSAPR